MRRFPPEMLIHVFHHCIDSLLDDTRTRSSLNPNQAPWNLSRVCRRWREIALNEPSLWSQVCIVKQYGSIPAAPLLLQQQLIRSQHLPLEIVVKPDLHALGRNSSLLSILAEVSERWETVTVVVVANSAPYAQRILNERAGQFSALKKLHWYQVEDEPVSAFEVAPLLRSVVWTGRSFGRNTLPWSQLTQFSLFISRDPESRGRLFEVLACLVHVVELQISAQRSARLQSRGELFVLPKLQLLRLGGNSHLLRHILRRMLAPSLSSFSLRELSLPHGNFAPVSSQITRLHLSNLEPDLDMDNLIASLQDIEALEQVDIAFNQVAYSHGMDIRPLLVAWTCLDRLTVNPRLSIFGIRNGRVDSGTLMQMLLSRWDIGSEIFVADTQADSGHNQIKVAIPRCVRLVHHHWVPGLEDDEETYLDIHEERLECIADLGLQHLYFTDDGDRVQTTHSPDFCDACQEAAKDPWRKNEDRQRQEF